ncbi:MAG: tetratricopeptide repeat protein [bacterium]
MLADLLWIKTVSYFGSHFMTDKEYPWLFHMLSRIIDLDPRFDFPYYFGGIVLSLEASQAENANQILERGMEAYPDKWEYPFYFGFNLYYHLEDPLKAALYIERASLLPGAPPFTKTLTGTLYERSGKNQTALNFYKEIYKNTTDEIVRKNVADRIEKILSEKRKDGSRN